VTRKTFLRLERRYQHVETSQIQHLRPEGLVGQTREHNEVRRSAVSPWPSKGLPSCRRCGHARRAAPQTRWLRNKAKAPQPIGSLMQFPVFPGRESLEVEPDQRAKGLTARAHCGPLRIGIDSSDRPLIDFSAGCATSNGSLRYQPAELGKCPVLARERMLGIGATAKAGQDPLMPCSRAYFVQFGSAANAQPSHHVRLVECHRFWEILRIAAISLTGCPSATSCTTSRWRSVSSPEVSPDPSGQPRQLAKMSFLIKGVNVGPTLKYLVDGVQQLHRGAPLQDVAGPLPRKGPGDVSSIRVHW